jgi:hypothetical protein
VEFAEARPARWRGGLSGTGGDFDFDFDFGRPGGRGLFARDFPTGDGGAVAGGAHGDELRGVGRVDPGVGDPAGGVRGIQAERGGALGNWLASVADAPEEALVREHAAWALAR